MTLESVKISIKNVKFDSSFKHGGATPTHAQSLIYDILILILGTY